MNDLPFHRLGLIRRNARWWAPLVTGLLGVALYVAMMLVLVVVEVVRLLAAAPELSVEMTQQVVFDLADPLSVAFMLLSIVIMLPAYLLASRIVAGRPLGFVSSVAGRLRWGWMARCTGAAAAVMVAVTALSMLLPGEDLAGASGGVPGATSGTAVLAPGDNPMLWVTFAVLIVVIPLQCAAEEYVFRGYLMQGIGRWLRHPAWAIVLPVPVFVLGHLYDPLGQAAVAVFAVAAGWLTWRTGGLEAAIGMHVVNNLMAFLLALAGLSDINDSSPGWASLLVSIVTLGAYIAVVERLARRVRPARTLTMPAPQLPPASTYAAVS